MNQTSTISRRTALERIALLIGGTISAPVMAGLLGGCRTNPTEELTPLLLLDTDQHQLINLLTDHIIPATDTPSASEAGVPRFIDKMLADWFEDEDRQHFLNGLADVEVRAQQMHNAGFATLEPAQQIALMEVLDEAAYADKPSADETRVAEEVAEAAQQGTDAMQREEQEQVAGSPEVGGDPQAAPPAATVPDPDLPPFFRVLKELTLAGYYTSEVGMTQELRWLAAPGYYDGDIPLSEVGRSWA